MYTYIYIYMLYVCILVFLCIYIYMLFLYNAHHWFCLLCVGWVPATVHCMQPSSNYDGAAPTGNLGYSLDMQWIRVWILILCDLPTPNRNDTAYLYFTLGLHRFSLSGVWLHLKVETEALISKWPQELRDWFNGQTKHYLHAEHIVPWTVVLMWSYRDT